MTGAPLRIQAIHLLPVGEGLRRPFLDPMAATLSQLFQVPCHVRSDRLDADFSFSPERGQYFSTAILERLVPLAAGNDEIRLIGLTELDLFVPVLTFVFGEAQLNGRCALVSLHRLREEFYGLPERGDLLAERAIKEAVHELGHTFGLRHCFDWRCVMASTHAVERLDVKSAEFCPACQRVLLK